KPLFECRIPSDLFMSHRYSVWKFLRVAGKSDAPPHEQECEDGNAIYEGQYAQSHRLRAQGISAAAKEF
ncbi:MAG: hypothetical protein DMG74_21415, partial [Acidobacteria bacterium]